MTRYTFWAIYDKTTRTIVVDDANYAAARQRAHAQAGQCIALVLKSQR